MPPVICAKFILTFYRQSGSNIPKTINQHAIGVIFQAALFGTYHNTCETTHFSRKRHLFGCSFQVTSINTLIGPVMIVIVQNSTIFWSPIYFLNDQNYSVYTLYPLVIIMSFSLLICAYLTYNVVIIIWKVRKFHLNSTIIIMMLLGSWLEGCAGWIILLPYKYGFIQIEVTGRTFEIFENDRMDQMPNIILSMESLPFFIGSSMVWHYFAFITCGTAAFIIERTIATFSFSDYETKSRIWLTVLLTGGVNICALFINAIYCIHLFRLKTIALISSIQILTLLPYFLFLKHYNTRIRNRLRIGSYSICSLTAKFQAEENVRSLKLASRVAYLIGFLATFFTISIFFIALNLADTFTLLQITELQIILNPLLVVPVVMSSVPEWWQTFFRQMPIMQRRMRQIRTNSNAKLVRRKTEDVSNIYFQQLQSSWI